MKILITGATGFLGRSLREHYEKNHRVIVWGRHSSNPASAVAWEKPDLVINCAGEIYDAATMYDANVGIVNDFLNGIKNNSPSTRFITIGSSSEYGKADHPTSERDMINPVDVYQATKGAATLLCQGYARQFGIQTLVARIYSGYGAYEKSHRLFPRLYSAFFEDKEMTLFDGVHDFIYIDDFIRGIDTVLEHPWPAGEIVNFGSGISYTNLEVLQAWEKITGRSAPVKYEPRLNKAFESAVWQCDPQYALDKYQFKTLISLEQGIERFIKTKQGIL